MRWLNNMNETIKRGIRSWLNVVPASRNCIQINEVLDFEAECHSEPHLVPWRR